MHHPLARYFQLDQDLASKKGCKILGVLGSQGSGKTLMSKMLGQCLEAQGKKVMYFSSDDFYLPYADRKILQEKNPFLKFRFSLVTLEVRQALMTRIIWIR